MWSVDSVPSVFVTKLTVEPVPELDSDFQYRRTSRHRFYVRRKADTIQHDTDTLIWLELKV